MGMGPCREWHCGGNILVTDSLFISLPRGCKVDPVVEHLPTHRLIHVVRQLPKVEQVDEVDPMRHTSRNLRHTPEVGVDCGVPLR